jgi:transposase
MARECRVRFWERVGVRSPGATRLPLYRQAEIFAGEGVNLETSTLSDWVGATAAALNR